MSKFYITYGTKPEFYSYKVVNDKIYYTELTAQETEILLRNVNRNKIINIEERESNIELICANDNRIIIDDVRIFNYKNIEYRDQLKIIENKIINFKKPKINRNKKLGKGKKTLLANLAVIILLNSAAHIVKDEIKKDIKPVDDNKPSYSTVIEHIESSSEPEIKYEIEDFKQEIEEHKGEIIEELKPSLLEKVPEIKVEEKKDEETVNIEETITTSKPSVESNLINVSLAFDDITENGKLEQTIENCESYVDKYIERYGLPKDLTYALICQEYGILDCRVNSGGASGPMQIQVNAMHNEYFSVPVYKDGIFTGEYDEFYAVDESKANSPEFVGKNIKIIQNLEDNFQIGCAHLRRCIDKYKNIFIALDAYNKGLYAFEMSASAEDIRYYQENIGDFNWTNIIPQKFGQNYGDANYLYNVLRYLDTDANGIATIKYFYKGELKVVDLINTNVYNNEFSR